jgi:hypothetical protein
MAGGVFLLPPRRVFQESGNMYAGRPESKDCLVIGEKLVNKIKKLFYIITIGPESFFYIIPMKIQALVVLSDEFLPL